MYSNDEIPSGYNSGEQYDTLSTGYMSGEAYELPDTRMDLREPTLDVIEEGGAMGVGGGGGGGPGGAMSDEEEGESDGVFMIGPPPHLLANSAITGVHPNAGQLSLKGSIKEGAVSSAVADHVLDCGSSSTSDQDQMDVERMQEEGGENTIQRMSPKSYFHIIILNFQHKMLIKIIKIMLKMRRRFIGWQK